MQVTGESARVSQLKSNDDLIKGQLRITQVSGNLCHESRLCFRYSSLGNRNPSIEELRLNNVCCDIH